MEGKEEKTIKEKSTVLIVDDNEINRTILNDMILTLGHVPLQAENGLSALAKVRKHPVDLILLDILMPEMDGYQVLENLKADKILRKLPVIIISALGEIESVVRCIEKGADDYLVKPFNPILLKARIGTCLEKKRLHDHENIYLRQIEDYNLNLEECVRKQVQEITSGHLTTIFAMAKLAESRDPETGEHLERMAEYCKILSEKLRLLPKYASKIDEGFIENIFAASPLHDIGKVGIPDRILQKPEKLTDEEFSVMKTHTVISAETLKGVDRKHQGNEFIRVGIKIAESHHEKWDGTGYPHALAGEGIPLVARILALADVYDALTSKRCYKEAFSHANSLGIILDGRGKHFDPEVVDAFVSASEEFIVICKKHADS